MNKVYCSECGKKISKNAVICLNCGGKQNLDSVKTKTNIKINQSLIKMVKLVEFGIVLGILFNFFAYIYSWKEDYYKFWIMLVIYFLLSITFSKLGNYSIYFALFLMLIIITDFLSKKDSEFYIWKK